MPCDHQHFVAVDQPSAEPAERVLMLAPMLADSDPRVRKSAAIALGRMACPEATEALCALLTDADEGVRVLACQALGRAADPASTLALLGCAHDASREVRSGILWAVANIAAHGGPGHGALPAEARSELFTPVCVLAFDPDDAVRADAAAVLGALRDGRATDALTVLLEDDCPRVRANACASLGLTDDAMGLEALLGVLEEEGEEPLVLVSALDGVARRAERGTVAPASPTAARAVAALCRLAGGTRAAAAGGGPTVRAAAASPTFDGEATPSDVRSTAVWALGRVGDLDPASADDVARILDAALIADDEWTCRYAAEARVLLGIDAAPGA